jgi:hypothetical protein
MKAQVEVQKITQNLEREKKQAEITVVNAKAAADKVRMEGEAEAAAINARGKALRENPGVVGLEIAQRWDGHLPTTMPPGATLPMLNIK